MPFYPAELTDEGAKYVAAVAEAGGDLNAARNNLWKAVAAARAAYVPWRFIGAALGVSRQAAEERFSKPPGGKLGA